MDQNQDPMQNQTNQIPQNVEQPWQVPIQSVPPPERGSHTKFIILAAILVIASVAGALLWQFIPKTEQSNLLTNPEPLSDNMNTPDPKMKVAYDGYFNSIEANNYADFIKVVDPEQITQLEESPFGPETSFGFLVQQAKDGGMIATIKNAKFIKTIDISSRYNIPTLMAYLAEYEHQTEDPLDGIGGPKRGPFTTAVNVMFMTEVNGEWKVKSFSTFNYRKAGDQSKDQADFEDELERLLKSIIF